MANFVYICTRSGYEQYPYNNDGSQNFTQIFGACPSDSQVGFVDLDTLYQPLTTPPTTPTTGFDYSTINSEELSGAFGAGFTVEATLLLLVLAARHVLDAIKHG